MKLIFITVLTFGLSFSSIAQDLPNLEAYFSAFIVKDIDQSIDWYSKNLGFEVLDKTENEAYGFSQANLKRGSIAIELIEIKNSINPAEVVPNFNKKTKVQGIFKVGFLVSDLDEWVKHLKKNAVTFHGDVVTDKSGQRMVILKDPDGNKIQLFEN